MIKYRRDIDGLRALAVLPVLFYHAQIPGFSGGFVGVDVFFVISGYLITGILIQDMQAGRYTLGGFYERRIRRILPALLTVLVFVLLASPFSLLPSEFGSLWKDALGALFFVANIVFWSQSGYFSAVAETKPLLHMWSLGIEEQFYIFVPFALWLTLKYAKRHLTLILWVALITSFVACVLLTPKFPSGSFYLLPTRAWELLAGSVLASLPSLDQTTRKRWHGLAAWSGLLMLSVAIFGYSKGISFPGYAAAVPVVASSLLIRYGEGTRVAKLLSLRLFVAVGLISYSLYLWHWPLVVFAKNGGWLETGTGKIVVVAMSVVMAYLTWRYIENPTRNRELFTPRRLGLIVAAGVLGVSVAAGIFSQLGGWPQRFPASVVAFDDGRDDISPYRNSCHIDGGLRDVAKLCSLGGDRPSVLVWGDSHGVELASGIADAGIPVIQATYSSCPPELGHSERAHRPKCAAHNRELLKFVSTSNVDTVVLAAYYKQQNERLREMTELATVLQGMGKRVLVVGPTPTLPDLADLPTHLARGGTQQTPAPDTTDAFRAAFGSEVDLVLPEELFCRDTRCDLVVSANPLLFDGHHPSMTAARITGAHVAKCLLTSGACK